MRQNGEKNAARSRSSEEPWRSHSTAICRDWVAKRNRSSQSRYTNLQLQNRSSTAKRKNDDFEALCKRNLKRKIISTKMEKNLLPEPHSKLSCCHWLQYDLRLSAAKHNSIMHAPAAARNLDATTPLRSAETELHSTIEFRTTATQIAVPKQDLDAQAAKLWFWSSF